MRLALLLAAALAGCGVSTAASSGGSAGDVVYLVHNQLWSVALDGSNAHALAVVGDDPHRTGFPRRLGDGRLAVLADDTGAIYPYIGPYVQDDGAFHAVGGRNVSVRDALCGARVGGAATLVYTMTPFDGDFGQLMRVDDARAGGSAVSVAAEHDGLVVEPAPWDDGAVLAVRVTRAAVTVEIVDITGGGGREVLATIDPPYSAHAPARLRDGRVVFVRTDPRDLTESALGELFVLERGGAARTTGITGVVALTVAGDDVIYEVGGASGVSDLSRTNLRDPPVNLTRTPHVAEHLGWSD